MKRSKTKSKQMRKPYEVVALRAMMYLDAKIFSVKIGSGANQKEKEEERWLRWLAIKDFHLASNLTSCGFAWHMHMQHMHEPWINYSVWRHACHICHAMYFNFQAIGCVCVSSWHAEGGDSWREGSGSQNGSSGFRVETVATASVFSVAAGNWCGPMGSLA